MNKRFHLLITLPLVIVLGATLCFLLLPYLFNRYLSPSLLSGLPFTAKELSIASISPWKIRGTMTLADGDRPTLSVPSFELQYTPGSLLHGRITALLVDSASLEAKMRAGQPIIRGLPGRNTSAVQEDNTFALLLPLAVETIMLKDCRLTVHRQQQKAVTILVDGRFSLDFLAQPGGKKRPATLAGQLETGGDLTARGEFGLQAKGDGYEARGRIEAADLGQLATLAPNLPDLQLKGGLSLVGQAHFSPSFRRLSGYEATINLSGLKLERDGVILEGGSADQPVTLQLNGEQDKMHYTLTNLVLATPEKAALELTGEMAMAEAAFSGTGRLLSDRTHSALSISYKGAKSQEAIKLHFQLASDPFSLGDSLSFGPATAEGDVEIKGSTATAILNSHIPQIAIKKAETTLVDLSLRLPLQYPLPVNSGPAGELKIGEIRYRGGNSGSLKATVLSSFKEVAFTTMFTSSAVAGLQLTCAGSAQSPANIFARCTLPATRLDSSTFPRFAFLPKKLSFTGQLAARGEFHLQDDIPSGTLSVDYRDGTLTYDKNHLTKIDCSVSFPRLPLLQSSPSQLCTIGALELGKVKMSAARIHFRIEDNLSFFLEKSRLTWCGGKVETGSLVLARDMKELETTLYCDRLGFTELLRQFGIDKAEGQGSLNGKLPLRLGKQGLVFDDGFLFSTPGDSGIVRFKDTRQLLQGTADGTTNAYLDYSMKALENFAYNWAKLTFNSEKKDLLIGMQLDGKPAEPLPFGYNNGQIVPSGQGPGLQHPIRLDVNFRLPLQDLFQYGKGIQSLMENM